MRLTARRVGTGSPKVRTLACSKARTLLSLAGSSYSENRGIRKYRKEKKIQITKLPFMTLPTKATSSMALRDAIRRSVA